MAYCEDLINQAILLCDHHPADEEPNQANLRRAISSLYYALFHLLTTDAAENWKHERQRHRFARVFDHGKMKQASARLLSKEIPKDDSTARINALRLHIMAQIFVNLQQARHTADYDHSRFWSRVQVYEDVYRAVKAIEEWKLVRDTEEAQDYLLDMITGR